ncbi:hypothetical protein BHE74_00026279 [Ensete ventricosum]|nr:hypothetical protein BHE74_00026279 [Ensete ventricosum]
MGDAVRPVPPGTYRSDSLSVRGPVATRRKKKKNRKRRRRRRRGEVPRTALAATPLEGRPRAVAALALSLPALP